MLPQTSLNHSKLIKDEEDFINYIDELYGNFYFFYLSIWDVKY